jgi:hypothetical protein
MLAGAVASRSVSTAQGERHYFTMSKSATHFIHSLVAVLGGNALYFGLARFLPPRAQHVAFRFDLGMVVDFWFCLVVFGVVKTLAGRGRDSGRPKRSP